MIILDAMVAGVFFVGGAILGALVVAGAVFTAWCFGWPRWLWK